MDIACKGEETKTAEDIGHAGLVIKFNKPKVRIPDPGLGWRRSVYGLSGLSWVVVESLGVSLPGPVGR